MQVEYIQVSSIQVSDSQVSDTQVSDSQVSDTQVSDTHVNIPCHCGSVLIIQRVHTAGSCSQPVQSSIEYIII